jgi:hypothetical protein
MRAADDIALANWGLSWFKEDQPRMRRHIQAGACRYFIRLQCGHLCEAVKLVDKFKENANLVHILSRCTPYAQEGYHRLLEVVPDGARRKQFEKWILPIRNKIAFHYDESLTSKALERRLRNHDARRSTITRGSEMSLWRFVVADDIEDTIICRLLWKIPPNADIRSEADLRADFGSQLCVDFLDFAGDLIFRYISDYAAL